MSARPGQHLHQFDTRTKEPGEFLRADLHVQTAAQFWLLRCHADGAVIGVAHARGNTAHGLHG